MGQTLNKTFGSNSHAVHDHPLAPFTQFTDLYDSILWDEKVVRKMICGGVLAPIVKGSESNAELVDCEECPICFLYNNQMNTTTCCRQAVCTECYLQVRPPKTKTTCPFCNSQEFSARVRLTNPDVKVFHARDNESNPLHATQRPHVVSSPKSIHIAKKTPNTIPTYSTQSSPPVSSSYERRELEDSMRRQRAASAEADFERNMARLSFDPQNPSTPNLATRNSENHVQRSGVPRRHSSGAGISDLRRMEEMMLSEAIRASLMESNEVVEPEPLNYCNSIDSVASVPSPRSDPSSVPIDEPRAERESDCEDELLNLAIAMSLQTDAVDVQDNQASPPAPTLAVAPIDISSPSKLSPVLESAMLVVNSPSSSPSTSNGKSSTSPSPPTPPLMDEVCAGGGLEVEDKSSLLEELTTSGFTASQAKTTMALYGQQLQELNVMGFTDMSLNVGLLDRYQGRLVRVVNALSDRDSLPQSSSASQLETSLMTKNHVLSSSNSFIEKAEENAPTQSSIVDTGSGEEEAPQLPLQISKNEVKS